MACTIPANPDISGIGVRFAMYLQNLLLSFIPAVWALKDNKVTHTELKAIEAQSVTILITAFAILISTIIQSQLFGLSTFHATIVLNLSWMNNTNAFVYFLLYVHHYSESAGRTEGWAAARKLLRGDLYSALDRYTSLSCRQLRSGFGVIHATSSSVPLTFTCSIDNVRISVFGIGLSLSSEVLRRFSLAAYSLVLLPGLNLLLPVAFFLAIQITYHHIMKIFGHETKRSPIPAIFGLLFLAAVNTLLLISNEISIQGVRDIQDPGESDWTFGQVLSLLLLVLPLRDAIKFASEKRNGCVGQPGGGGIPLSNQPGARVHLGRPEV